MTEGTDQPIIAKLPPLRRVTIDAARVGRRRHPTYGLIEVDVTDPLARLDGQSVTAYIAATVGRALAEEPTVQARVDWRGRLVTYSTADIAVLVEVATPAGPRAVAHVLRGCERRSVEALTAELRDVKSDPSHSPSGRMAALARSWAWVPAPLRLLVYRVLGRFPGVARRVVGTSVITAVGMFGRGRVGWALTFPTYYGFGVTVGPVARKPRVVDEQVLPRDVLHLTLLFDHDVIDGAPATRFANTLVAMLEDGRVLDDR